MTHILTFNIITMSQKDLEYNPFNGFLKINDTLYNPRYIKTLVCTDQSCEMTFANTEHLLGTPLDDYNKDKLFSCSKKRNPECYRRLCSYVESANSSKL